MARSSDATVIHPICFDARGNALPDQRQQLAEALATRPQTARLLVLCHGWLTDRDSAMALYRNMLSATPALMRGLIVAGLHWPSLPFTVDHAKESESILISQLSDLSEREDEDGDGTDLPAYPSLTISSPAAGLLSSAGSVLSGRSLIRYLSYRVMKNRAGLIGLHGIAPWLASLPDDLRVHLVGHSFGARALCAAVMAGDAGRASCLTLLQGALSHGAFGLGTGRLPTGYFRPIITGRMVNGPIIVTHTRADRAISTAYALASRLLRQDAAGIGGVGDRYGGMGANGALRLAEGEVSRQVTRLKGAGGYHGFAGGQVHNLLADGLISGHGDIANAAIGNLLAEILFSRPVLQPQAAKLDPADAVP